MPRRQIVSPPSSETDSDRSNDQHTVSEALYNSLQLADALQRAQDYATAANELAAIFGCKLFLRCSKPVQALVVQHTATAIEHCDARLQSRTALAALMAAAERHLPQARRKELARQYRQRGLWLHRGQQRLGSGSGPGGSDEDSDSERAEPATIHELPSDVRDHVLRYLDPISLACAACVSREWRDAASRDALWQRHCSRIKTPIAGSRPSRRTCRASSSSSNRASCRQQFAAEATQHPERLLQWRTNRVLAGRQLRWLEPGRDASMSVRHVGTSAVLAYLRCGGRRAIASSSSNSSSDSSSDSSSGSDCESTGADAAPNLASRVRLWRL
ncbi:F-box protein [Chlorella vulgaris]